MADWSFHEMQQIQTELQEKYKNKWRPLSPEIGKDQLLWLMIELGEVADVLKKNGNEKVMEDTEVRTHFIEELCDVMMYFNDILLCYEIDAEELEHEYVTKHRRNMTRW